MSDSRTTYMELPNGKNGNAMSFIETILAIWLALR